jgi:hypothetical protein
MPGLGPTARWHPGLTGKSVSAVNPIPAPTISLLAPDSDVEAGGATVTVTGTGFIAAATTVTIGATTIPAGSVDVDSATSLTFVAPAGTVGSVDVSVTTAGGTSNELPFEYEAPHLLIQLGVHAWWDASDTATITASGGAVSQIADKSGNGRDPAQPTGANQPSSGSVTIGGLNALGFDGGDFLRYAGSTGVDIGVMTAFVVAGEASKVINAGFLVLHHTSGNDWDSANAIVLETGPSNLRPAATSVWANTSHGGSAALANDIFMMRCDHNGVTGTASLRLLRGAVTDVGIDTSLGAHGVAGGGFVIGGRYLSGAAVAGANGLNGRIGEVIVFDRPLTNAEMNQVGEYLEAKWGLTWTTYSG